MAGVKLSYTIQDEQVRAHLAHLLEAGQNLTPLMDDIGILIEGSTKDRLNDTNVAPDGVPWPISLRAKDGGGKTLRDSGTLSNSITFIAGGDYVEVGSNIIYAGVHQEGAVITPKNGDKLYFALPGGGLAVVDEVTIPARPYLGLSDTDTININDLVEGHFGGSFLQ